MKHIREGQAGFTLLEMLVAMALFSLTLSYFGVLFYKLGKTNVAINRIERSENVDVVRRYMQQSLEGIRPHSQLETDGVRILRFDGERSRVAFIGVATGDRETGGLYDTEFWLDSSGRLLLRRRHLGRDRGGQSTPEVLLEGIASLTFSYSACPHDAHGLDIHRWERGRQLPFMISVNATFKPGDSRQWREISAFIPAAACQLGAK